MKRTVYTKYFWLLLMLVLATVSAQAQIVSRYAMDDARIFQKYPDSINYQMANLKAYEEEDGNKVISYIKFDISGLNGSLVESASLSIRGVTGNTAFVDLFELQLKGVTGEWDGKTLKWANKPGESGNLASFFLTTSSLRRDFVNNGQNLVNFINDRVREGKNVVSFAIVSNGNYDKDPTMWMGGLKNGNWGPMLNMTLSSQKENYAIDDARVFEKYPDSVNKVMSNLKAFRDTEGKRVISYVKFDISHLKGTVLDNAAISFRGLTSLDELVDKFGLEIRGVKADWSGDTLKWATRPNEESTNLATTKLTKSSLRRDFENNSTQLVNFINERIREGKSTVSFTIRSAGVDDIDPGMWIGGKKDGSWGPILKYTISPQLTGYAIDDARIFEKYPDSVNKVMSNLKAFKDAEGKRTVSYVKFDISGAKGNLVEAASLSFRGKTGVVEYVDKFEVQVVGVLPDWKGDTLKWATRPEESGSILAKTFLNANSNRKDFDNVGNNLVNFLNDRIREGKSSVSFIIKSNGDFDQDPNMWIGGKKDGTWGVILNYSLTPDVSGYPSDDGRVFEVFPDSVNYTMKNIKSFRDSNGKRVVSYVKFDLTGQNGALVDNASFSIRGVTTLDELVDKYKIELRGVTNDWAGDTLKWRTKPGWASTNLASILLNKSSARRDFTNNSTQLVNYINERIREGKSFVAFALVSTASDVDPSMWIGGKKDGNYGPILTLNKTSLFKIKNDTVSVIENTYVSEAEPTINYSTKDSLLINNTAGTKKEVWLKFDVSKVHPGIGTASLIFDGGEKEGDVTKRYRLAVAACDTSTWSESTLTWSNKLTVGSNLATYDLDRTKTIHTISSLALAEYIKAALANKKTHITLVVKASDARAWNAFVKNRSISAARLAFDYSNQTNVVIEDSWVSEIEPAKNFDGTNDLQVSKDPEATASKETYLKFDISSGRSNFVTAILRLRGDQQGTTKKNPIEDFYVEVYRGGDNWKEDTLKWNNKPTTTGNALASINILSSTWHEVKSAALTELVKTEIIKGTKTLTLVLKARDNTPGHNVWFGSKNWTNNGAQLVLDYRKVVETPVFVTNQPGLYVPQVSFKLRTATEGAIIYYTTDGSVPTINSTKYDDAVGIVLNDTATVKAIAVKDGWANSEPLSGKYDVSKVSVPTFDPNPLIEYNNNVTVKINVVPSDAFILYSNDGGDPQTLYDPNEGIYLNSTTTIKTRGVRSLDEVVYMSPVTEANFVIVNPVAGIGTGPAGVGSKDNAITGQPENPLWLKADAIVDKNNGDKILTWEDVSGNENHAVNGYVDGQDPQPKIDNTSEREKPAPVYVKNGLNGMPVLRFGEAGQRAGLVIPDNDNLDGGTGISLYMVMKRNEMHADFAALIQKRNNNINTQHAYVLEMNGGADPHTIQFVINKGNYFKPTLKYNDTDYYLVNVELDGKDKKVYFRTNGNQLMANNFNGMIINSHAPVLIGGFQAMDIAEIAMYKSSLNPAQNVIVTNYLASKYNLNVQNRLYSNQEYKYDLIGIGSELNRDGVTTGKHVSASGAGLELEMAGSFANGAYVLAGHNGAAHAQADDNNAWARRWYIKPIGTTGSIRIGFNYQVAGLDLPSNSSGLKLYYDNGDGFVEKSTAPIIEDNLVSFIVESIAEGVYAIGTSTPTIELSAPQLTPVPGDYPEIPDLTLAGPVGATIYYTLDGSEPNTSSTVYTDPITVEQNEVTIKAIAVKGDLTSAVTVGQYKIITAVDKEFSRSITIYPNPSHNSNLNLRIENEEIGDVTVRVVDVVGRSLREMIKSKSSYYFDTEIQTADLRPGIYMIEILQNGKRDIKRLVKN